MSKLIKPAEPKKDELVNAEVMEESAITDSKQTESSHLELVIILIIVSLEVLVVCVVFL